MFPNVGIELLKKRGDAVSEGEDVCRLYAESEERMKIALEQVRSAYSFGKSAPAPEKMILEEIAEL